MIGCVSTRGAAKELPRAEQGNQVIDKWDGSDAENHMADAENHRVPRASKANNLAEMTAMPAQYTSPTSKNRPVALFFTRNASLEILELPTSSGPGIRFALRALTAPDF